MGFKKIDIVLIVIEVLAGFYATGGGLYSACEYIGEKFGVQGGIVFLVIGVLLFAYCIYLLFKLLCSANRRFTHKEVR